MELFGIQVSQKFITGRLSNPVFGFMQPARAHMTTTTKPNKQQIREWLERRTHAQLDPPPTPDEIRRELGWHLLPHTAQPDSDETP